MTCDPVTPLQLELPLNDPSVSWEDFEKFCVDFIHQLPKVKECHRYGKRGNKQEGIDIFADLDTGERCVFSCKQYQTFYPNDAEKAITAMTYTADYYILLLSCEATSGVRNKWCAKGPKRKVWDTCDIARKIRYDLSIDHAHRLIETHFGPEWRKHFLGIKGVKLFVSPKEFFRPLMDSKNLFNHVWSLVGRVEVLNELHEFVDSETHQVLLLSGRGGVGKTKLLQSFSENFAELHQEKMLWFVEEGVPITPESADELPTGPCVVVVDDAHRREDLSVLLTLAQKRSIKLLLSFRPYATERIRSMLMNAKFDSRKINGLETIKILSKEELKELALQVLGSEYAHFADQLVGVSRDSPLVTVVGGRLLVEKGIDPRLLERDEEFQRAVLDKFQDFLIEGVGEQIEPDLCRKLLNLIAAVSPIRPSEIEFQHVAAAFLDIDPPELMRLLDILENSGLLLRRGYALRITPDVLSDHILHKACLNARGESTGYARFVFETFKATSLAQMLNNLAELDWRIRQVGSKETDLIADVWRSITDEFQIATNFKRCEILSFLEEVAYYQPERTLKLVEFAMRNPATTPEDGTFSGIYEFDHGNVLGKLPRLLKYISFTLDYLPRCCDLLWELGKDDTRELNQTPEHGIRILGDLASYDIDKPIIFNQIVLDAVGKWLKKPDVRNHFHSPLEILDSFFGICGKSHRSDRYKIILTPFLVSRESVQPVYKHALELLEGCTNSDQPKVVIHAINILNNIIINIIFCSREYSDDVLAQWAPEGLKVLDIVESLANRNTNPLVQLKIMNAINWIADFDPSVEVKAKMKTRSQQIIDSISNTYELCLTQVLCNSYRPPNTKRKNIEDVRRNSIKLNREIAKEFLTIHQEASEGVDDLNNRLQAIKDVGIDPYPGAFLYEISEMNPNYAADICEIIIDAPRIPIATYLDSFLCSTRLINIDRALDIARRVIDTKDVNLCCAVARVHSYGIWASAPLPDDFELVKQLIVHHDIGVRILAIRSLGILAHFERLNGFNIKLKAYICDEAEQSEIVRTFCDIDLNLRKVVIKSLDIFALTENRFGIDIALNFVDVGDNAELAEELCSIFDIKRGILLDDLTDDQLHALIQKFEYSQRIEGYSISHLLSYSTKRMPYSVLQLLLNRIKLIEECSGTKRFDYNPLPIMGFDKDVLKGFKESAEYENILRRICEFALEHKRNPWISSLFKASSNFDPASLEILNEWIESQEYIKIEATRNLLKDVPSNFIFEQVAFISYLLERAYDIGDECYRNVCNDLHNSVIKGGCIRPHGEPSQKDIKIREQASNVLEQLSLGSPVHSFYNSMKEYAEMSIKRDLIRDEEFD
jgi:hypothetical protein